MITWQNSPQMMMLRAFQRQLSDRNRQTAHDLGRALDGRPPDRPCWLDLSTAGLSPGPGVAMGAQRAGVPHGQPGLRSHL